MPDALRGTAEGPHTTQSAPSSELALDFAAPAVIIRTMLTPGRAIDDFLGDCRRRRWSERSIRSYLVPPEGYLSREGGRDDRIVWRLIKRVAARAGVDAHVHALRAAFACFYLERNPDDLLGLKELLGHRSLNTTLIYLRRLNKQAAMERVRTLSWATPDAAWLSESPPTDLGDLSLSGGGRIRTSVAGAAADDEGSREHPSVARVARELERARLLAELAALDRTPEAVTSEAVPPTWRAEA